MAAEEFGAIDCSKCARQPDLMDTWFHWAQGEIVFILYPDTPWEIILDRCPLRFLDEEIFLAMDLYWPWKEGKYPIAGGYLDQAYVGVQAFKTLDHYFGLLNARRRT